MSKKILLIEDHREIRHLTAKCLRHLGYDLVEAEDGQLGVRMALAENPDLVLLDLSLPVVSGFEVARKMKENLKTSHIAIIGRSAWLGQEIVTRSLKAGMVEYVSKPCSTKKIESVIKRHIGPAVSARL